MSACRLIIFDWDGTVADSAGQIVAAMQQSIADLGLPPRQDRQIRELIGLSLADGMALLYPEIDTASLLRLLAEYRRNWGRDGDAGRSALFPGALETMTVLRDAGFRLAVATGKSRIGLERSLAQHPRVASLLVNWRTADTTASKPDPLMLTELLADDGLAPGEALMVGDTEFDAAMATAIGMPMVGVTCGAHDGERIARGGAVALLEMVRDLPAWLTAAR